jgi:hypothetical protein
MVRPKPICTNNLPTTTRISGSGTRRRNLLAGSRVHIEVRCVLLFAAACTQAARAPSIEQNAPVTVVKAHAPNASPHRVGDSSAKGSVTAVQILASVDGGAAGDRPTYVRVDQKVTLHALVRVGTKYFTDAPSPQLAGKPISAEPLAKAPAVELAWVRIEPSTANMSNTQSGSFKFETIDSADAHHRSRRGHRHDAIPARRHAG